MGNRLVVNYADLESFSKYLSDSSFEFKKIRDNMNSILSNLENSWYGSDYFEFVDNARKYIDGLVAIENNLCNFSNFAGSRLSYYNKVTNDYIDNSKNRRHHV